MSAGVSSLNLSAQDHNKCAHTSTVYFPLLSVKQHASSVCGAACGEITKTRRSLKVKR